MTEQHCYPSNYGPGAHWATDAAWELLDHIKPGVIPDDVRAWLAGAFAGRLTREREHADTLAAVITDWFRKGWQTTAQEQLAIRERIDAAIAALSKAEDNHTANRYSDGTSPRNDA
jgi:hypothetical protein